MKICFFNSDFPPRKGGIANFNWGLAYHLSLAKQVEHVQVVSFKSQPKSHENYSQKLSIIRLSQIGLWAMFWGVWKYLYQFRDYDIFHATNLFPVGFLLVLLGRFIFRKPVFITFHGTDVISSRASRKTKLAKYFTLKYASRAIAVSHSTLNQAVNYYRFKPEKFSVIYYALAPKVINKERKNITRKELREKYNLAGDDFVVLTVANLVKRKGIVDLIKAVSLIDNSKIKLIIVGQGPERENLENLVRELRIANRVIFTGLVEDVEPFYLSADVFVLPSFFIKEEGDIEGLGIVFLEAQQCDLPVIGTKSGGIPEAIADGQSGFIVPERDPVSIKEKILVLANNRQLCSQMGNYAQRFVREKFDQSKSVEKHLSLYGLKH